jgi:AcrR family transcriptional regulator
MGRPRTGRASAGADPQLSREEIVAAALKLTREVGVDGFTMRGLADELGVTAPAMYHYVPGKQQLRELIVDAVLDLVPFPPETDDGWTGQLRRYNADFIAVLREHRGVAALFVRERPSAGMLRHIDWVLTVLLRAGFDPRHALRAFEALTALALGQALTESGHARSGDDVRRRLRGVTPAHPELYPALARLSAEIATSDREDYFTSSLELLLSGLTAELEGSRRATRRPRRRR